MGKKFMLAIALLMVIFQVEAQCDLMACTPPTYMSGSTPTTSFPGCTRTIFYTYQICGSTIELVSFYVIVIPTGGPMAPGCDDYIQNDIQKIVRAILLSASSSPAPTTLMIPAGCAKYTMEVVGNDGGFYTRYSFTPCSPGCCTFPINDYLNYNFSGINFGDQNCPAGCTALCWQ